MAIRKVVNMGHPVLRKQAAKVPEERIHTKEFQQFLQDMTETMFEYDGRGLAAPQINESIQVVVMLWDFDSEKEPHLVFLINPELEALTEETSGYWEGCLSVPGLRGYVARPNKMRVKALNQHGKKVEFIAEGFAATVVQHECDHLMGKLYVDRVTDITKLVFNQEYVRYHAKEGESEEEAE